MSAVDSAKKPKAKQPSHLAKFIERHTTKSLTRKGVYVASTELRLHPFAELLPAMSDADLATLTADIAENGQREPIWITDDGEILDGRHRWRALAKLGTGCWCEYVSQRFISGKEELFDFVMSMNLHRRHLSDSQRAMLAAERATLGKGQRSKKSGKSAGVQAPTVAEAAKALQVSPRSVEKAKKVAVKGPKVLKDLVSGGKVSVSLAEEAVAVLDKESIEFLCRPGAKQTPAAALKNAIFEVGKKLHHEGHEGSGQLTVDSGEVATEGTEAVDSGPLTVDSGEVTTEGTEHTEGGATGSAARQPAVVKGSRVGGDPSAWREEPGGFDFGFLVELCRDINEVLGGAGDLAVGNPTEDQVRFLVDHLDGAVGKLVEIRDTWNLCLVEEESS